MKKRSRCRCCCCCFWGASFTLLLLFCRSLKPVGTESKSAIIIVVFVIVVLPFAFSICLCTSHGYSQTHIQSKAKQSQSRTCVIHLAPCGPDPATIGTDAVSACASSSCDVVVVVVVVVLESFFSIFFLRCSHTFVLLSRLLSHSLARSLTHLYVSHTVIAVAFVVLVVVVVLTSVCSYYLRCANSLAISFVFVRFFFALPIRYSLLVLSFAHGICFCMTLASAFAASFYVLKKIKTANLLQLCRTRRRRRRQLLAQRRRRQDETRR